LTAEFTSRRDLQDLLNLVANTVVDVLRAKSCSIRLLSEDRKELVIKAVAHLSREYLNKGPILVSQSQIDSQVLTTLKPVYIADERIDPRVMYPAEARREGIVSGLVAPLAYKGRPEGVIRVYMGKRHKFDWFEASLLEAVAGEASAAIVNARLYQEAIHYANMRRALTMAAEVQRRMIPSEAPVVSGFQVASLYVPTYELGGDFFDFIALPPGNLGIAVCDVVGKGVRASLLMASIRASLRAHASSIYEMSEVMARVNRDLCEDVLTSDFATLFYGVLDYRDRRFTYCNAGHPAPMLLGTSQVQVRTLSAGGMVIGVSTEARYRCDSFVISPGQFILAYTDGLAEAMNFADEAFGAARIEKAARAALEQGQSADGILHHVLWEMRRFAGLQTRFDDLTLLGIKAL
jgi:sigma-B regulation protein RsbU (phosphoserine phosphatase)